MLEKLAQHLFPGGRVRCGMLDIHGIQLKIGRMESCVVAGHAVLIENCLVRGWGEMGREQAMAIVLCRLDAEIP